MIKNILIGILIFMQVCSWVFGYVQATEHQRSALDLMYYSESSEKMKEELNQEMNEIKIELEEVKGKLKEYQN